jgi:cyclopropane-fatty-acyl-phospholipid synthase
MPMLKTKEISPKKIFTNPSLYQKVIVNVLTALPYGKMTLTLHTGEVIVIGNQDGSFVANLTIKNPDFYKKGFLYADVGFGESYMDGDWETEDLTKLISWFLYNAEYAAFVSGGKMKQIGLNLFNFLNKAYHYSRDNSITGSKKNIVEHYDLGNKFYKLWLDKSMTYSSAYFASADMSLEEAQFQKYDRLCKLLKLKSTDRVLEIGSGWGDNAIHIAKYYGCKVTSVTISEEQFRMATQRVKEEGLSDKVEIKLMDYRKIEGKYDKIVSIEMLEAVGAKYLKTYFAKCWQVLDKNGLLALQVITCPDSRFDAFKKGVDFIQKHIFPGSLLPSVGGINKAINQTGQLSLIDMKDLGQDYAKTLRLWSENFNACLSEVRSQGFDDKFIRKWNYYLSYCEAAFAMRNINVMQMLYSAPNNLSY